MTNIDGAASRAAVGILMLDTRFPRIPGDIGNPATWPFPTLYRRVPNASPHRVVRERAVGLVPAFIEAGRALIAEGADGITTSCGFLALAQEDLAAALKVPVATSSLLQVPLIERLLPPGKRCGVLTVSASSLSLGHLSAAGVASDTPIGTTEGGRELTRALLSDAAELDIAAARADVVDAATDLQRDHANVGAVLLECTNMAPYAADVREATGLPVYSIETFVRWFQSGLQPRRF
ncbi:MAG: aspartate/glutamate racemase family protein [Pseudomonadota bacterium]